MNVRLRKFLGLFLIAFYLLAYVVVVAMIGDALPDNRLVELVYYVAAGFGWVLPLMPMIKWMEHGRLR
ncbi:DUF2842 domain-containing protein [Phenylobacterium deserti]|uniref:DUF2842 domain-containing protein n=1 Tax=Phenylobacterium deserti TaxID=1914756 RepID=A0A328ACU7_9CAUL|nr:DUF2842 domain-containing protein [Phenylobacterium deserti]RAK52036.1 DUF2842 domain-containing protein [Phenylobacterium deserti]